MTPGLTRWYRVWFGVWFGVCTALIIPAAYAASIFDFDLWMRKIDKKIVLVQRNMTAGDTAAALGTAREIEQLYGQMQEFLAHQEGLDEAAKLAELDKSRAASMVSALEQNDSAKGAEAAIAIAKACSNCHEVYRPFK